jgi:hypothetical protein
LIIGGKNVPAGSYTIFTIPGEAQWTLIINKKTGEWGAPYQYESDELARIDMHASQIASSFENFTIAFDPKGDSCPLTVSWENTQASVQVAEIMPGAHATVDLATLQQRAHTAQGATQSVPPNSDDAKQLYATAMDLLGKAYSGSDKKAHAVPGMAAAFIAVMQADPAGPYGARAREILTIPGMVWPDWNGQIPAIPKPSTNRRPVYSQPPTSGPSVAQAASAEPPQPAPPDSDDANVQAQLEQRQQRIDELQSDIDEQEQEAATWEQSENNMDDSSTCSGPGAALCQTIGNLGAAKARENANKARNQADEDRRELAELEGQPAPVFHKRDTSYAGALANEQQEHPTPSVLDAGDQQAAAILATGDANAAQQRAAAQKQAAAQQRTAAQRSAQQAATNRSSNPQNGTSQTAGAVLPTGHTFAPLTVRFGTVSGHQGNAHVVSTPPGIDCPSVCSFQFGEGAAVMLFATADQNSAVKGLSCQMSSGTGMLQAGNEMGCSIPQWAYEGGPVTVYVDLYPRPGTNSSGSNGQGANGTRLGGNANSSGSGGSGSSGGNSGTYLAPITQGCVREFWNPKFYDWLSFENDCGQAINLTWIAKSPSDRFGAANANIAPGQSTNTGWSQTEVATKGGFALFICPAGSVAVDGNTDQMVNSPNATYSCKKQ